MVEHKEPILKVRMKSATGDGEREQERTIRTDGEETTDQMEGGQMKSKARWEGRELAVESTIQSSHFPESGGETARLTQR